MVIAATEAQFSGPYSHDGTTTVYDYDFRIYTAAELTVTRTNADGTLTTLAITTDYTVAGVGDAGGGEFTLVNVDRLPTGTTMTAEPSISRSQTRPFSSQSSISLAQIEVSLDKLTSLARQVYGLTLRAPKVATGAVLGVLTRGADTTVLQWDADGNIIEGPTTAQIAASNAAGISAADDAAQTALDRVATAADRSAIDAKFTVSTDTPSGGNEGDVWFQYSI